MKLKFRITVCLVMLLLLGSATYVYSVNEANGDNLIMSSAKSPLFLSQCVENTATLPLDTDGKLSVSVWNIYKQQRSSWSSVLTELLDSSELVLLQEAKLSTGLKSFLQEDSHQVLMAKAFKVFKTPIGVMNLAKVSAESACAYQAIEPWIRFAKSALVSTYPLSNGENLLVVNLHGINFAWRLKEYRKQISLLAEQIKAHNGPVIMAGDFNTWRQGRVDMIGEFMLQLGMTEAKYAVDKRNRVFGLALDHLYNSGLVLDEAHVTPTKASDHNPIQASFSLIQKN